MMLSGGTMGKPSRFDIVTRAPLRTSTAFGIASCTAIFIASSLVGCGARSELWQTRLEEEPNAPMSSNATPFAASPTAEAVSAVPAPTPANDFTTSSSRANDTLAPVPSTDQASGASLDLAPGMVLETELVSHVGAIKCGAVETSGGLVATYCTSGRCCGYDDGSTSCRTPDYDCDDDQLGWPLPMACDGAEDCPVGQACYYGQVMSSRSLKCRQPPPPPTAPADEYGGKIYPEDVRQVCDPQAGDGSCVGEGVHCEPCTSLECANKGYCVKD